MRDRGTRVPSYDVLRLVATLCVVFIHVSACSLQLDGSEWPWLLSANRHLIRYAVPAFFLITGALVWGRPDGVRASGGYRRFMGRRARVVLVPYLLWGVAYLVIPMLLGSRPTATDAFVGLLTGRVWYHLYFVPAIMVVYALTPLAERVARVSPESLVFIALVAHLFVPMVLDGLAPLVPGVVQSVLSAAAIYLPHAALGALIARRGLEAPVLRRGWPLLLATSLYLMASRSAILPPDAALYRTLTVVASLGVLAGALGFCSIAAGSRPLRNMAERVGPLTYAVYLVHPLLIEVLRRVAPATMTGFIWHDRLGYWVTFAGVFCLSLAVSWLQSRLLDRYMRPRQVLGRLQSEPVRLPGK